MTVEERIGEAVEYAQAGLDNIGHASDPTSNTLRLLLSSVLALADAIQATTLDTGGAHKRLDRLIDRMYLER